jgi:hypothetical protein
VYVSHERLDSLPGPFPHLAAGPILTDGETTSIHGTHFIHQMIIQPETLSVLSSENRTIADIENLLLMHSQRPQFLEFPERMFMFFLSISSKTFLLCDRSRFSLADTYT